MADQKRGDDAANHVPTSEAAKGLQKPDAPRSKPQDAPNYDGRIDDGRAEPVADLNSANDA